MSKAKEKTEHEIWTRLQLSNGDAGYEAEFSMGKQVVTASVMPDFDWRADGVLWGVRFPRYMPRNPLERREIVNKITGVVTLVDPPPILPEKRVGGRIRPSQFEAGEQLDLDELLALGRRKAEAVVGLGRYGAVE